MHIENATYWGDAPFFIAISEAIAVELGAGLQRQRLNGNKTQNQLAEELGVSKPAIGQL